MLICKVVVGGGGGGGDGVGSGGDGVVIICCIDVWVFIVVSFHCWLEVCLLMWGGKQLLMCRDLVDLKAW